jgi:hypothetical protein
MERTRNKFEIIVLVSEYEFITDCDIISTSFRRIYQIIKVAENIVTSNSIRMKFIKLNNSA